jgi:hypothetical protein
MTRLAGIALLLGAAATVLFLFLLKDDVRALEADLEATQRRIVAHQEAIHVLRTEWSYLNQPARIADLARRHLGLGPLPADRVVRLDDLPERPARVTAEPATRGARARPANGEAPR